MEGREEPLTSIHVRRAVRGDRESLGWLVGHLDPLLRAQVRMRLGNRAQNVADVDDLVAEAWSVALRNLERLEARDGRLAPVFVAFLSSTTTNLCNGFLRRAIRNRLRSGAEGAEDSSPRIEGLAAETRGVVTRVDGFEVRDTIQSALDRLGEDKRDLLVLRLLEQRSNTEIAEDLGIPANTVAVRYRRALAELRARLPRGVYEGFRNATFGAGLSRDDS